MRGKSANGTIERTGHDLQFIGTTPGIQSGLDEFFLKQFRATVYIRPGVGVRIQTGILPSTSPLTHGLSPIAVRLERRETPPGNANSDEPFESHLEPVGNTVLYRLTIP